MLKRPQQSVVPDDQEQQHLKTEFVDDTLSHQPHKSHSRHSKNNASHPHNHTSRHHKKHEKEIIEDSVTTSRTTTESTATSEVTLSTKKSISEERTTGASPVIPPTEIEESAQTVTSRPKKNGRRQRPREGFDSSPGLEVEDEKNQQRRKKHHKRKNSTLLTNSVHDEIISEVLATPETPVEITEAKLNFGTDRDYKTEVSFHFKLCKIFMKSLKFFPDKKITKFNRHLQVLTLQIPLTTLPPTRCIEMSCKLLVAITSP